MLDMPIFSAVFYSVVLKVKLLIFLEPIDLKTALRLFIFGLEPFGRPQINIIFEHSLVLHIVFLVYCMKQDFSRVIHI